MPDVSRRHFLSLTGQSVASLLAIPAVARVGTLYVPSAPTAPNSAPVEFNPGTTLLHDAWGHVRVAALGIGSAGREMVHAALHAEPDGVGYAAIDQQMMPSSSCCPSLISIELPAQPRRGLCHHASPEHGCFAAEACADEIARVIDGAGLVVLVAGMGGGTGTGAAPVVAELAHDAGALVAALVTRPHSLEGKRRNERAAAGIDALTRMCDATFVVPLAACVAAVGREAPYRCVFECARSVVGAGLRVLTATSPMRSGSHSVRDLIRPGVREIPLLPIGCGSGRTTVTP